MAQGGSRSLTCTKCGRNHPGDFLNGKTGCFKCGHEGHLIKDCPKNKQGGGNCGNRAQSSSAPPPGRAAPRGATSGTCEGINHLYDLNNREEQEISPDVVTGMIKVFTFYDYASLDQGESLSFLTPYVAN